MRRESIKLLLRLARFRKACKRLPKIKYPSAIIAAARLQGIVMEDRK